MIEAVLVDFTWTKENNRDVIATRFDSIADFLWLFFVVHYISFGFLVLIAKAVLILRLFSGSHWRDPAMSSMNGLIICLATQETMYCALPAAMVSATCFLGF